MLKLLVDEGRKRVLSIAASILAARKRTRPAPVCQATLDCAWSVRPLLLLLFKKAVILSIR
jgi:hypothetical protein